MTTSSPKQNYNYLYLRGSEDVDDMEYVEEFDLPKHVAYTKEINEWMLDYQQTKNEDYFKSQGMDESAAKAKARSNRMKAAKEIELLYELNNL